MRVALDIRGTQLILREALESLARCSEFCTVDVLSDVGPLSGISDANAYPDAIVGKNYYFPPKMSTGGGPAAADLSFANRLVFKGHVVRKVRHADVLASLEALAIVRSVVAIPP